MDGRLWRGRCEVIGYRGRTPRMLCLLVPAFLMAGCEERDRDNPFDPLNPSTGGEPSVVEAVAGDSQVRLTWSLSGLDDIETIQLQRLQGAADPVIVQESGNLEGAFEDVTVENGVTYSYHAVVVARDGLQLETRSDLATPGRAVPWVGDASASGLSRLSPDGRDRLFRAQFNRSLLDLAFDSSGRLWGADFFQGQVVRLGEDGVVEDAFEQFGANALAFDSETGQLWVGAFADQSISRRTLTGQRIFYLPDLGPIEDLEPKRDRNGVWIAVRDVGLVEIEDDRVSRRWNNFVWPVAVSSTDHEWIWVVDRGQVGVSRLFKSSGVIVESKAEFGDPRDCSADADGGLYVADTGRGGIIHLDGNGDEVSFWEVGGASGVTFDPQTGNVWVVVRNEARVEVFDSAGVSLARVSVGGSPVKVEANW